MFSYRLWLGVGILAVSTAGVLRLLSVSHEGSRLALLELFAEQQQEQAALAAQQLERIEDDLLADISRVLWQGAASPTELAVQLAAASSELPMRLTSSPPGAAPGVLLAMPDPGQLQRDHVLEVTLPVSDGIAITATVKMAQIGEQLGRTRQGSDIWLVARDSGVLLASADPRWLGSDLRASAGVCLPDFEALLRTKSGRLSYCWPDGDAISDRIAGFVGVDFFGIPAVVGVSADSTVLRAPLSRAEAVTRWTAMLTSVSALLMLLLGFLEQRATRRREREDSISALNALGSALEARDPYTRFHSENVAAYAAELARLMGLSAKEQEDVRLVGMMHDIGKIGICDAVLNKPGRLTDEERAEIQRHAELGEHILCHFSWAGDLAAAVGAHHERMDGCGYPRGLAGETIPLHARIVAVADVFDALITDRPYRAGMPLPRVVQIITEMGGEHLDPDIVAVFLEDPASLLSLGRGVRMDPPAPVEVPEPSYSAAKAG
ncbi:MAG: HD-GYP domain-containing protein (c-di-GMP phosphodiesterase class II) [Myxococcota bacterium]